MGYYIAVLYILHIWHPSPRTSPTCLIDILSQIAAQNILQVHIPPTPESFLKEASIEITAVHLSSYLTKMLSCCPLPESKKSVSPKARLWFGYTLFPLSPPTSPKIET